MSGGSFLRTGSSFAKLLKNLIRHVRGHNPLIHLFTPCSSSPCHVLEFVLGPRQKQKSKHPASEEHMVVRGPIGQQQAQD